MKRAYFKSADVAHKFANKVYALGYEYVSELMPSSGFKISWYKR